MEPVVFAADLSKTIQRAALIGLGLVWVPIGALISVSLIAQEVSPSLISKGASYALSTDHPEQVLEALRRGSVFLLKFAVPAIAAVAALAALAVPILLAGRRGDDWIGMDSGGLTLCSLDKRCHWNWSELADIKLHSRFHPAALLFGRFMTAHVPDDHHRSSLVRLGRRLLFPAPVVIIGNDYLTPIDRITDTIIGHKAAYPGEEASAAAASIPMNGPTTFWIRKKPPRPSVFGALAGVGLFAPPLFMMLLVLHPFISAMRSDVTVLESIPNSAWALGGGITAFAVISVLCAALFSRCDRRSRNYVRLSTDGLLIVQRGNRRWWSWPEIHRLELRDGETKSELDIINAHDALIAITAHHGGTRERIRRFAPETAFVIDDIYDAPIHEIAHQAEMWRERTLEHQSHRVVPRRNRIGPKANSGSGIETSAYQQRRSVGRISAVDLLGGSIGIGVLWVFAVSATCFVLFHLEKIPVPRPDMLMWAIAVLLLLGLLVPEFILFRSRDQNANFLSMGPEGIVCARMGLKWRVAWSDLASIELNTARLCWRPGLSDILVLTVRRNDWLSKFMGRCYGVQAQGPVVVVEDVYEAPLAEIGRTLIARRDGDPGGRIA